MGKKVTPLIERLVELIREEIGAMAPGDRLPPELSLARHHRVARKTIRAALDILEEERLVQRIRGKGTFASHGPHMRAVFRPKVRRLGLVSWFRLFGPHDSAGFYTNVLAGIMNEAFASNTEIVVAQGAHPRTRAEACYRLCDEAGVDGVLLLSVTDQELLDQLAARDKAMCLVDHHVDRASMDCVRIDSRRTAELAVEHLYRLGHQRIAYIQQDQPGVDSDRLEGFRAALNRYGLGFRSDYVVDSYVDQAGGARAAGHLLGLEDDQRPTGIVTFNTEMAEGAIEAIEGFGLRVPQDISVVAGGGVLGKTPSDLTAVLFDPVRLGRTAVQQLSSRIGDPAADFMDIVLPVELQVGSTTDRVV